jgi:hypothetical protein
MAPLMRGQGSAEESQPEHDMTQHLVGPKQTAGKYIAQDDLQQP